MIHFYSKNAGPQLRALLEELASRGDERLSLAGEIDASRALSLQAFKLFDAATSSDKASIETRLAAASHLRSSMEAVGDLAVRAARIAALSNETVRVEAIGWVVEQVAAVIDRVVREERPDLADAAVEAIKGIKLPKVAVAEGVNPKEFL